GARAPVSRVFRPPQRLGEGVPGPGPDGSGRRGVSAGVFARQHTVAVRSDSAFPPRTGAAGVAGAPVAGDGFAPRKELRMSCRFVVRAVVLASLLAAAPAFATRVVHFDTRALVHESSDIVIGEVAGIQAHWNERHTKIVTDVEIRVSQTLKGVPTERLTLRQLGGEVDGMRYRVPGSP